jgi:hypothetical protein
MTKYDKIYIPDEKGDFKVQQFYEDYHEYTDMHDGTGDVSELYNVIVLTEDELLDLMQESIEHSYPTLLREKAKSLLAAKLDQSNPL